MTGGIQHRNAQTCPDCKQIFMWSPASGLCPYCDLSIKGRQTGPYGESRPCPSDCCTEERKS